jgi:4-hydroxybenzoate polyprenyltransferase
MIPKSEYLRVLRIRSWVGWIFYFVFGSLAFAIPPVNVAFVFVSFFLCTAGIFVLNQYFDKGCDRFHFYKKHLPIAAESISQNRALTIIIFLNLSAFLLIMVIDFSLLPLYLVYLILGICYSAPPIRLKSRPIIDVVAIGISSGVLPFLIGLQVSHQLTLELSLPWIIRRYQDAFLTMLPIMFFQCATHILQAVGDHEADTKAGVKTFASKFGKKNSVRIAKSLIMTSLLLPFFFGLFNLSLTNYVSWYVMLLIPSLAYLSFATINLRNPSKYSIKHLSDKAKRLGPIIYIILASFVLFIRIRLST